MAGKLSVAAVALLVVVPLCVYTCALLVVGIQLGRALERVPADSSISFSIRDVLNFAVKELWDGGVFGRGSGERSYMQQSKQHRTQWCPLPLESSSPPVVRRCNDREYTSLLMQFQRQQMVLQRLMAQQGVDLPGNHRSQHSPNVLASGRDNERSPSMQSPKDGYIPWSTLPPESRVISHASSPRGVISVGPWGGSGGQPFYPMRGEREPRLLSITVHHSPGAIHSLACEYHVPGDNSFRTAAGPWGRPNSFTSSSGSGPRRAIVELSAGERVTAVEGTTGHFGDVPGEVVTSLTFRTSKGRTYGPYGGGRQGRGTKPFSVPVADGACVAGFWGRSGWLLDALGVYVGPCKYPANWYRYRSD